MLKIKFVLRCVRDITLKTTNIPEKLSNIKINRQIPCIRIRNAIWLK